MLRTDHPAAVDNTWATRDKPLPIWLALPTIDSEMEQRLLDWAATDSWTATLDRLTADADHLLTDRAEASLHHLIEHNPYSTVLEQHLTLLTAARTDGIDTVRTTILAQISAAELRRLLNEWIATPDWTASAEHLTTHQDELLTDDADAELTEMTAEEPGLLGYLGLLGVARAVGVTEAHQLVTEPDQLPDALDTPDPTLRLALARWGAGQEHAGPADHLTHALAALDVDATDEAEWAAERCRSASPTWELPSLLTRLDEYARTHPDRDTTPLRATLLATPT
jgi:hypothetical protein